MSERGTGVFGAVFNTSENKSEGTVTVTIESVSEDSSETIYDLIFRDFDEEKN